MGKSGFSAQKEQFTSVYKIRHDFLTVHSIETNHVLVDVELIVLQGVLNLKCLSITFRKW